MASTTRTASTRSRARTVCAASTAPEKARVLSSAATSLALFGRQLERADFLARVLRVHLDHSLDRSDDPGAGFWSGLMQLAGWPGSDVDHREQAVELLVVGAAGPSVRGSVAAARSAAQAVRPSLPSELYEQVNSLFWRAEEGRLVE